MWGETEKVTVTTGLQQVKNTIPKVNRQRLPVPACRWLSRNSLSKEAVPSDPAPNDARGRSEPVAPRFVLIILPGDSEATGAEAGGGVTIE